MRRAARLALAAAATMIVAFAAATCAAAATPAASGPWPPGTEIVPFELRDGLILVRSTLRSPSGRDTTGLLVFDTGAPDLAVTLGVWRRVQLDTVGSMGGRGVAKRRPLDAVELGPVRVANLEVGGVIPDGVLTGATLGLFGPSLLGDRAIVVNYETRRLAIVNRSLTLISHDGSTAGAVEPAAIDRVRRSRARYGAVLPASAVAVPFRMFRGGRMLVSARLEEAGAGWKSAPLSLLVDTGASACAIFDDAVAEQIGRADRWPRLRDMPFHTVLGERRMDLVVAPRLTLIGASTPVSEPAVEVGLTARRSLPDLQGELPDPVHGLLGYSFFRRFRLVLDYADEVLWLTPTGAAASVVATAPGALTRVASPVSGTGLVLERPWGKLAVAAVIAGSPAAGSGVQAGDAVISIDGDPAASLEVDEAQRRLDGGAGAVVVVVVRRGGMERVLRLPRGRGTTAH